MPKRYTITAALPYANGPIHIGHLAGVYIPADTYARYLRLKNRDVAFICGSDEHGVAIDIKAKNEGKTPKQIIDYYDQIIRKSFDNFGISFDNYSRTSSKIHHDTASEIFIELHENIIFYTDDGEKLSSNYATFDIQNDIIKMSENVSHKNIKGLILSDDSIITNNFNKITFFGNVESFIITSE